jgi:hypothetical protein
MVGSDRKVWKTNAGDQAGMEITPESAAMVGNEKSWLRADQNGWTAYGKVSLITAADDIRIAGLWTMQNHFKGTVPSTLASPVPQYEISPPVSGIADIIKSIQFIKKFLI